MNQNLPARQGERPLTAVQQRALKAAQMKKHMLDAVISHREDIERSLRAHGVDFDAFQVAVEVGLERIANTDEEFFDKVPVQNFLREVVRAAHVALKPDGKQGAIVRFANDCTFMPMVEGYTEIIWKTGLVRDVNSGVVVEGDEFDFEEGDEGFVRHKRNLSRAHDAKPLAAWCVINLVTGGKIIEICDQGELARIASVNKSTKGPRAQGWAREMDRKAPYRRGVKKLPKSERLDALIALDDRNVRLESAQPVEDGAPSAKALFGNRPIRRPRKEAASPVEDAGDAVMDAVVEEKDAGGSSPDTPREDTDDSGERVRAPAALQEEGEGAADAPFVLRAVLGKKNGLQEFDNPDLWYGDIRTKMRALEADPLRVFWKINKPHVEAAGRNGHGPLALQLVELARELHLEGERHDAAE